MKLYYTEEEQKFVYLRNTCLVLFFISTIYSVFDIGFMLYMPEMNGTISSVETTVTSGRSSKRRYYLQLTSGSKKQIPIRLYNRVTEGQNINYTEASFWATVDNKRIRLFRLYPLLLSILSGVSIFFICKHIAYEAPIASYLYSTEKHPIPIIAYIGVIITALGYLTDF